MVKKVTGSFVVIVLCLSIGFYLWGSSSHFPSADYNKIVSYADPDSQHDSDTLSILTYNLGYLSGMTNNLPVDRTEQLHEDNLAKVNSVLAQINPNVVAFQEIDFGADRSFSVNQLARMAEANDYGFGGMAVNWDKRYVPFPFWPPSNHFGKMLSGQAIMSRFEITSNDRIVLEKPGDNPFFYNAFYIDRLAQITTVEMKGVEIKIINVHLDAFDISTRQNQAQVILAIYQDLVKTFPVLLVGDFNSAPPFASVNDAEDKSMDAFFREPGLSGAITKVAYQQSESDHYTFNSRDPYQMIDYIFYSARHIKPVTSRVVHEAGEASDHLPVLFEFTLR